MAANNVARVRHIGLEVGGGSSGGRNRSGCLVEWVLNDSLPFCRKLDRIVIEVEEMLCRAV